MASSNSTQAIAARHTVAAAALHNERLAALGADDVAGACSQHLLGLAALSKHGHAFAAALESQEVCRRDVLFRRAFRHVYGFADSSVGVALKCRLHPNMPRGVDFMCRREQRGDLAGFADAA